MKWILYIAILVFGCLSAVVIFNENYILNKICLITYNDYFIPLESNATDFRPIVWNNEKGEYWVYGEDKFFYYHAGDGAIPNDYIVIEKSIASQCMGFDPNRLPTGS